MKKLYSLLLMALGFSINSIAQCPTGQINVTVDVITDSWGYECFWDLTPTGNGCGNGALFTFGNTLEVNCTSGGSALAVSGGYPDNSTVTETLGCLSLGNCFDINYVDDYGDGGATFVVKFNGVIAQTFTNDEFTVTATHTFCVANPPVYDAAMLPTFSKYTMLPISQTNALLPPVEIQSAGTGTITGVKANLKVKAGANVVHTASSATQTLPTLTTGTFSFSPYTPTSFGPHEVIYTTQITELDEVNTNDSTSFSIEITDTILAIDDNISLEVIGLGSGELGYLGNIFEISNATNATSVSIYLGNGIQVSGVSAVDSVFTMRIFNTNAQGVPTTVLASASGVIVNVLEKWYTVSFTSPVSLAPGKYMVAIEEEFYVQEVGLSEVFHPETSYIYSTTLAPWSPVEDFGLPITFMIRLNLGSGGLGVSQLTDSKLAIYPNPASTELTIANTTSGAAVQVYNQMGQMVYSTATIEGQTTITIESLANGLYTVKTIEESTIGVAKFIKE